MQSYAHVSSAHGRGVQAPRPGGAPGLEPERSLLTGHGPGCRPLPRTRPSEPSQGVPDAPGCGCWDRGLVRRPLFWGLCSGPGASGVVTPASACRVCTSHPRSVCDTRLSGHTSEVTQCAGAEHGLGPTSGSSPQPVVPRLLLEVQGGGGASCFSLQCL